MEYITEPRGGWDERSDGYTAIVGVIIGGTEYSCYLTDVFTDTHGNNLTVDFPLRENIEKTIDVERHSPEYKV